MIQLIVSLFAGWCADLFLGDPPRWPHPVVWFGRAVGSCEHRLNHGQHRKLKGCIIALTLPVLVFFIVLAAEMCADAVPTLLAPYTGNIPQWIVKLPILRTLFDAILIFYFLAGTTLIREVRQVFIALERSLDDGRQQVARIVGRDTSQLSEQEVRTAALETLAENLSDGVIAPLFWLVLLGVPGMAAYKMVNTLDSMIGYRTERYRDFGWCAAHLDDVTNYLPARLTALLMIIGYHKPRAFPSLLAFVRRNGRRHASPNSGYPEAALAAILDCQFGGPHLYFGQLVDKPYIGDNPRPLTLADMKVAIAVNRAAEIIMVSLSVICLGVSYYL